MKKETILTKINRVNLNSFVSPIKDDLLKITGELQNLIENNMDVVNFKALTLVENGRNIRAALTISNAYGEAKVVDRFCRLLEIIENGEFDKQSDYKEAVSIALMVSMQLEMHMEKLHEDVSYYAANLWKSWSKLGVCFLENNISINELFVPCGNFSDVEIKKVKKADLEKLVSRVAQEYRDAVLDYNTTSVKEKAKVALDKVLEIINVMSKIKSSHSFHEYWFAMIARIELALKDPNYELDNKADLISILNDSEINLVNFGSGSTKLNYNYLEKTCLALLSDTARDLSGKNEIIHEFYERFYIENFLEKSFEIMKNMDSSGNEDLENDFLRNIDAIKKDLSIMAHKWKDLEYNAGEKDDLLRLIKSFISEAKLSRFGKKLTQNELLIIVETYAKIFKAIVPKRKISDCLPHYLCMEYAAFHLIFEFYLDRKGEIDKDYTKMLINSSERIEAALDKDLDKLKSLPENEWIGTVKEKLDAELRSEVMSDLKLDLNKIKQAYKDFTNKSAVEELFFDNDDETESASNAKEKEAYEELIRLGGDFFYSRDLLKVMGYEYAASLVDAISKMIGNIKNKGMKQLNKESHDIFSTAIGACEVFFDDVINGSDHPEKILESAFSKIYRKDFVIDKKSEKFELTTLSSTQEGQEEKIIDEENTGKLIAHEEPVIPENEDVLPKINDVRNSEELFDEKQKQVFDPSYLEMKEISEEEMKKDAQVKVDEKDRKKAELEPRFISYDPDDEEYFVEDYIEEILSKEIAACFAENIEKLHKNPADKKAFKEIRRIFHTWKGSGKQVNLFSLGYTAEALNLLYDRRMDLNIEWNYRLEKTATIAFNNFIKWAEILLDKKEVYFDPTDIFAAIKEEEDFYQENLAPKDNEVIEDDDLTEELSIPSINKVKEEQYKNIDYKNDSNNGASVIIEEGKDKVEESEHSFGEKTKVLTETVCIDSIVKMSSEFSNEDVSFTHDDVGENNEIAVKQFKGITDKKEEESKIIESISFEENTKNENIECIISDNQSVIDNTLTPDVKEEEPIIIEENNEHVKTNNVSEEIVVRVNSELHEEIDLINQNMFVSDTLKERLEVLPDILKIYNDEEEEAISIFVEIIEDILKVSLNEEQSDKVTEYINKIITMNELKVKDYDYFDYNILQEMRDLEDFLFNETDNNTDDIIDNPVSQENNENIVSDISYEEQKPIVNTTMIEEDINAQERKLDFIIEKLNQMKNNLSEIKDILTDME